MWRVPKCNLARNLCVVTEAWAAKEAGLQVVLSVREGTVPLAQRDLETFPTITSFTQLLTSPSSSPAKKPKKTQEAAEKQEEVEEKGDEGDDKKEVEQGNGENEEKNGVKC